MLTIKPVGRNASSAKYDILTALGTYALAGTKHDQRLVLRFITLITARYNWSHNELACGQREIARLWSVDERTVKREMAKLRGLGWLEVKRQGARGHVTEYRMNIDRVLEVTRVHWGSVGPDFDIRMRGSEQPTASVVPLSTRAVPIAPDVSDGTEWSLAKAVLHAEDPASYGSWINALDRKERAGGRLVLRAPSRFHGTYVQTHMQSRILRACQSVDGTITEVVIHD